MNLFSPGKVSNVHVVKWNLKWCWWPVRSEHSNKWIWREPVYRGTIGFLIDDREYSEVYVYLTTEEYIFTTLRGDWDF